MTRPTVFVVDDDPGVRRSLTLALEGAGLNVTALGSAEEFLCVPPPQGDSCLVLDLRLSGMNGLELLSELRQRERQMPIVMLSGHGDVPVAVQSMKLGAVEFLEKPVSHAVLLQAVEHALRQDRQRRQNAGEASRARKRLESLTRREQQLLTWLAAGRSSKQIAAEMDISVRTVENHRAHLLRKTGAANVADLVRLAMLAGLESLDGSGGE